MIRVAVIFVCMSLLFACTDTTGADSQLPSRVSMVMRSQDTASVEVGIDAVPENDGIQVQWHKVYHPALKYYHLWRKGEHDLTFTKIKVIDPERSSQGGDTTYVDTDIIIRPPRYYRYYVAGANAEGKEGAPSDTVAYMLLEKAVLESPSQQAIEGDFVFKWIFSGDAPPQYYILRIEEEFTKKLAYSNIFWNNNFIPGLDTLNLSEKEPDLAFPKGNYRWRIDCIGEDAETSGSESQWLRFIIE
jgi:hypothetical protein